MDYCSKRAKVESNASLGGLCINEGTVITH